MSESSRTDTERADRILVVDDSPDNLFLVQTLLEDEGYEVWLAEDGFSAIEQIEKDPPQLVLLDVMMPEMDGYEVTRRIRGRENLPFIPILLITAYDQSSVVTGLDVGADDFIRKPVEVEELLARVRSLLRLKHSVDEREQMSRQREDFVSRLTHDLRTPLVAADRMLSLLRQGALGELSREMEDALTTMKRSNQNLLQMVNTLLEVYRYEAGSKQLTFGSFDFHELLDEAITSLKPLAEEKNLDLKIELGDREPTVRIKGDRLEWQRVFINLLGNAIKFTDSGFVAMRFHLETDTSVEPPRQWAIVSVRDSGPGIAEDTLATLFDRFRQGHHKRAGTGLGLHLSRTIVEAHGGTISVDSQLGEGSTFTVRLPLNPSDG